MIAGVDVNLRRVTVCWLNGGTDGAPAFSIVKAPPKATALDSARHLHRALAGAPWSGNYWTPATVVWIERPMGRFVKSVADLMRVFGAVVATIPDETPVDEIGPTEWKAAVGLPGNCGKPEVIRWATAELKYRHGHRLVEIPDEHCADALAVAVACERQSMRAAA